MMMEKPSETGGGDAFEVMGLEARAWLEESVVRGAYHGLAMRMHPDVAGGDAGRFARLSVALQELLSIPARLRCLLARAGREVDGGMLVPPEELMDFFQRAAGVLEPWQALGDQLEESAPALVKALLEKRRLEMLGLLQEVQAELEERWRGLEEGLRRWDAVEEKDWEALRALQVESLFLDRWRRKLGAAVFGG